MWLYIRGCIQKFPDWVDNEINNTVNPRWEATQGYGGKTHYTDLQNSDTTATSGRNLYHLQFLLQAASPETFGYILVFYRYVSSPKKTSLHLNAVKFLFSITSVVLNFEIWIKIQN
jgi:hypothetical protein